MAKKKAIKLATATAIAATAFVAAAPGQSEAATNSVDKAISNAKSKMLKAFNTYNKTARVEGKLPALSTIKKDVAAAKEAYVAAQKEISKNGGTKAKKAAYTKSLDANKKYLDRAELYLKAVTTNLKPSKEAFEKAVEAGKQYNVMTTQKAYQDKIAEFEAAVAKVYGPDARNLLTAKYADSANKLANSVNDEMAVYKAYRAIEQEGLLEKDLKAAYEKIEGVKAQAATIAKLDTKLAKNITAAVEKNNGKFEEAVKASITTNLESKTTEEDTITFSVKAPEGAEVQVIQNTDNDIKANADGTYTVKLVEGKNNIDIRTTTYGVKTANFFEVVSNQTPAVKSVSAINAKSLQVNFSKSVDPSKASFEVKKGTVKVNTEKVTFNEDKTAATIELTGKLTAGEYTVNVSGLTDKALSASTTVENEKVESVKILSENAVLNTDGDKVSVGYQVLNQYGEDITDTTPVLASAAGTVVKNTTPTATKGIATVEVDKSTVKEGDSVVLTLINTATGKSASQTVKVSAKSAVTDITISGLYNKDGKALTETTDLLKDAFYLVVDAKDQYGQAVSEAGLKNIIANNTNPLIAGINGGTNPTFETIKVDGKEVTAIRVTGTPRAGETNVMLISTASGKNASYTVKVAESQRTDAVSFQVPQLVVAGEELFVPIEVLDKEGKVVTDEKVIKDATRGIKVTGVEDATVKTVDGKLGVEVAAKDVKKGYLSLVAVSSTGKSTIANVQVKEAAKPVRVEGVTSKINTTILTGSDDQTITTDDVKIIDQYERELTSTQKATLFKDDYVLDIKEEKADAGAIKLDGAKVSPVAVGTEKVTIAIKKVGESTTISGSEKSIQFRVTNGQEYVSYQVEKVGTIFDEVGAKLKNDLAYNKAIEVYGVLDDGTKVELDNSKFTVDAPEYLDYSTGTFAMNGDDVPYAENATEHKANVTVTINATGEQLKQEVTVSKVKPTVKAVKVVDEKTTTTDVNTQAKFDKIQEVTKVESGLEEKKISDLVDYAVVDSYGVVSLNETGAATDYLSELKLTVTPSKAFDVIITNNNKSTATVANLDINEYATVVVSVNGVEKTFKVEGNYDREAVIANAEKAVKTAEANVAKAQDAKEAADKAVKAEKEVQTTATSELSKAQSAKTTATSELTEAQSAKTTATSELSEAKSAKDIADTALAADEDNAVKIKAAEDAATEVTNAEKALADATTAVTKAEKALEDATTEVTNAEKALEDAKKALKAL